MTLRKTFCFPLRAGTKYSVSVSGMFKGGESVPLAGEEKTTLSDAPEPPPLHDLGKAGNSSSLHLTPGRQPLHGAGLQTGCSLSRSRAAPEQLRGLRENPATGLKSVLSKGINVPGALESQSEV